MPDSDDFDFPEPGETEAKKKPTNSQKLDELVMALDRGVDVDRSLLKEMLLCAVEDARDMKDKLRAIGEMRKILKDEDASAFEGGGFDEALADDDDEFLGDNVVPLKRG